MNCRTLTLVLAALVATNAFAVAPQFWRIRSADEFLAGEIEGFAVTSRGELRVGPSLTKVATFTDPFVLSQAAASNGDRYFGTGNEGKVYRLRGGELKVVFTAPEPEIYALAWVNGTLYAGTSPNGKVYRVADDGKSSVHFDPQQAYIWALEALRGGDLAVATGVEGKLFRVNGAGQGRVVFDASETHIRSIAARRDGSILAGGSGQGRIYEVPANGAARALYDSALSEISALYVDPDGVGWAAAVSNSLPAAAPVRPQPKPAAQQTSTATSSSSAEPKKDEGSASVEVSFSFDEPSATTSTPAAPSGVGGEIYRVNADGFVETIRKFDREMVYALSGGPNGSVLLSTGPQGRVYELRDREVSLIATVPEKQVVSISSGSPTLITTTNSGAVYRVDATPNAKAEFRSAARDMERFSRFGNYTIEGSGIEGGSVAIAFRSGNTSTPDDTWSAWSAPSASPTGRIAAPAGRYLQWRLTMPKPAASLMVDGVTAAFVNRNIAPAIENVTVHDPAVVYISSSYPSSPQVVEATNPDEHGIFTSLDAPRDRNEQGKRMFRKGYRTVSWRARDENGDPLRYSLSFRPRGGEKWLRLRDNIEETQINFDTSQLPDGTYELRLVASDARENADAPLTDVHEGIEFLVDNELPSITASSEGGDVVVRVADRLSPVARVEYSADAQNWIRLTPGDGISDSQEESYRIPRGDASGRFVIVRAVDAFYNVATSSVTAR